MYKMKHGSLTSTALCVPTGVASLSFGAAKESIVMGKIGVSSFAQFHPTNILTAFSPISSHCHLCIPKNTGWLPQATMYKFKFK